MKNEHEANRAMATTPRPTERRTFEERRVSRESVERAEMAARRRDWKIFIVGMLVAAALAYGCLAMAVESVR